MDRNEWTTYDELEFLKNILKKKVGAYDKVKFMEKYKKAMVLRENWIGINKNEINLFLYKKWQNLTKGISL